MCEWLECIVEIVFFFQAEDGIRDSSVTGVQTCALPISEVQNSEQAVARAGHLGEGGYTNDFAHLMNQEGVTLGLETKREVIVGSFPRQRRRQRLGPERSSKAFVRILVPVVKEFFDQFV